MSSAPKAVTSTPVCASGPASCPDLFSLRAAFRALRAVAKGACNKPHDMLHAKMARNISKEVMHSLIRFSWSSDP